RCYVNDQLIFESTDAELTTGQIGLCKFRDTRAEYKNFQAAREIGSSAAPAEIIARITKSVANLPPEEGPKPELIDKLAPDGAAGVAVLRERARLLEQQAAQLRQLAQAVHHK